MSYTWDGGLTWAELGSSLDALQKVTERRAALERSVSDLLRQKETLTVEVEDLQRVRTSLQSEVEHWEKRIPRTYATEVVGVGDSSTQDDSWVDHEPKVERGGYRVPDDSCSCGYRKPCGHGRMVHRGGSQLILTAPAYTYALFDDQKKLIYIGVTKNWKNRKSAHARKGYTWYVLAGWPSEDVARSAESFAIHERHPPMNRCWCGGGGMSVGPNR